MESSNGSPSPGVRRRGSMFTDRQIYSAVKQGKAVRFTVPGQAVTGWVFGMDDFHWGVVTLAGEVHAVHKSASLVTFTEHLLERQPERSHIDELVAPFHAYVMRTVFKDPAST